jgi:hypothetical protein
MAAPYGSLGNGGFKTTYKKHSTVFADKFLVQIDLGARIDQVL